MNNEFIVLNIYGKMLIDVVYRANHFQNTQVTESIGESFAFSEDMTLWVSRMLVAEPWAEKRKKA